MFDSKQQAIFRAAQDLFAEKGFERATMDEIAVKAQVAKGTLFYRFKSKDELFLKLIGSAVEKFIHQLRMAIAVSNNTPERLGKIIEIQTKESFENPNFVKILLSEGWGNHERQMELRTCLKDYLAFLQEIIDQGISDGEVRCSNSSIMATAIFGMIASASLHLLIVKDSFEIQKTIDELKDYCFRGILNLS